MDAQKFGAFLAQVRKENGLTQAQLAQKIQVTDKAVSRWERGRGFPDINLLEPLAAALDISLLELMQSERVPAETVTTEEASAALRDTVHVARQHWRRIARRVLATAAVLLAVIALWLLVTGLIPHTDVFLHDYAVLPDGGVMAIRVGVASSMGYVRSCTDRSDDPARMELRFCSAFGGLNSKLGACNVFLLPLDEECTQICFEGYDGLRLILEKDPVTGEWERVPLGQKP